MAAELRAGRLPLRVRFEARGVFEPDQGLVRLRAWGRDRAAVREVLDAGVARVHRLDAGKLEPPRAAHAGTLESLRKQLAYTLKVALGPDDMERALRLAAEITKEEHLAGPLASTPTDVLVPPRIAGPDVERRLLPFVLGGQLSGALLGLLSLVVVGQRRDG